MGSARTHCYGEIFQDTIYRLLYCLWQLNHSSICPVQSSTTSTYMICIQTFLFDSDEQKIIWPAYGTGRHNVQWNILIVCDCLIDCCLTSSEKYFSYFHDDKITNNTVKLAWRGHLWDKALYCLWQLNHSSICPVQSCATSTYMICIQTFLFGNLY
jgi:hypothetical protein